MFMTDSIKPELIVNLASGAAEEVFATMLDLKLVKGTSHPEAGASSELDGVVALVGIAGPWIGTGSVTCTSALACKISSRFLMAEFDSVNSDVLDAMGELGNMIIGNFKVGIEEHVGPLGLSIPTVIHGRNFVTRTLSRQEWVTIPFDCEGERLEIKICLAKASISGQGRLLGKNHSLDLVVHP
jgi:chemotaxis protein CheX